jgi:hypothetical protein
MKKILLVILIFIILLYTFCYSINETKKFKIEIKELKRIVEEQKKDIEKIELTNKEVIENIGNNNLYNRNIYDELTKQIKELQKTIKYFNEYQQFRCYIENYNIETGELLIDEIEWLSYSDKERREELNLGDEITYIINEVEESIKYYTDNYTIFEILRDASTQVEVNSKEFHNRINSEDYVQIYEITIVNDKVLKVSQCYLP